jgi:hypothetical protein
MRRCSPRFWRVLSLPWLVSANVHAAAVLLLMCTLAPPEKRRSREIEIVLGDAAPATEIESVEIAAIEPPSEFDATPLAAPAAVREIDVSPVAAMAEAADRTPVQDRSSLAGAFPAAESLLTRVSRPWGQAGLPSAGTGGGAGAANQAAFFGTIAIGRRFVYILDMSGSMKEGGDGTAAGCRFRRAAEELLASVDRLSPDQVFYVYLFSTTTRPLFDEPPMNPIWRSATPEVKSLLRAWLASIEPGGGTDPRLALQLAAALRPDALFVLSDGRFSGKEQKIVRGLEQSDRPSEQEGNSAPGGIAPIHTFAFEDALACHSLQNLALATGGVYRFVPPIFRQGKRDKSPPIKDEVYAENLLKTAESLQRAGRSDEALEVHRILARDFPDTPAALESAERFAALAETAGES